MGPPLYPKENCCAPAPSWGAASPRTGKGVPWVGGWSLPCCPKAPVSPWQDASPCRCPRTWSGCHQVGARTCTKAPMGPVGDPLHFFLNGMEPLKCFMIPNMQAAHPAAGRTPRSESTGSSGHAQRAPGASCSPMGLVNQPPPGTFGDRHFTNPGVKTWARWDGGDLSSGGANARLRGGSTEAPPGGGLGCPRTCLRLNWRFYIAKITRMESGFQAPKPLE